MALFIQQLVVLKHEDVFLNFTLIAFLCQPHNKWLPLTENKLLLKKAAGAFRYALLFNALKFCKNDFNKAIKSLKTKKHNQIKIWKLLTFGCKGNSPSFNHFDLSGAQFYDLMFFAFTLPSKGFAVESSYHFTTSSLKVKNTDWRAVRAIHQVSITLIFLALNFTI